MIAEKSDFDFLDIDHDKDIEEVIDENSNPFYLPAIGSPYKYHKAKMLSEQSKNLFVICLRNDVKSTNENKKKISLLYDNCALTEDLSELVTIVKLPFFLINNQQIRSGLLLVDNSHLEKFNNGMYGPESSQIGTDEIELDECKSFVYLMLNSSERNVVKWVRTYEKKDTLDKFIKYKIFISYNNLSDAITENKLIGYISNVTDFHYWENKSNCNLAINLAFNQRKFNFRNKWKLNVDEIKRFGDEFALIKFKEKSVKIPQKKTKVRIDREANYEYPSAQNISYDTSKNILKTNFYVDASKPDKTSYFQISMPEDRIIDAETVNELLQSHALNEKEKYYLVTNLLVSKNYAHYILQNPDVLTSLAGMFKQYKPIFRYLLSYAFINLYKEESIKKTKTTTESRHVFNIETASKLPVFPHVTENPTLNPYFTLLVSSDTLNIDNNMGSVGNNFSFQTGIVDLVEFKRRLNIFTCGYEDVDLLEGISWSNMVITGGSMSAIMPKINPLMALFSPLKSGNLTEAEMNNYFNEYYKDSDIDVACNHNNFFDYIEHVKQMQQTICENSGFRSSDILISPLKTICIYVDTDVLKEKCDNNEIPFTYEYIINNKHNLDIRHYFYEIYLKEKKESNIYNKQILGNRINDPLYYIILDYSHIDDVSIVFRDHLETVFLGNRLDEYNITDGTKSGIKMFHDLDKNMNNIDSRNQNLIENNDNIVKSEALFIRTVDTIKYKIISTKLKHSFEVFRIDYPEFFSTISRFHFPCVRSYYNGETCYLTMSAISAYMTMSNIEYKFFSGSNDPFLIIHKYRQRGYTSYFNRGEINQIVGHVLSNEHYQNLYGVVNTESAMNMIGELDSNQTFFRPQNSGLHVNTVYQLQTKITDLVNYYKELYPSFPSELITKTAINNNGDINPLQRWLIDIGYDSLCQ